MTSSSRSNGGPALIEVSDALHADPEIAWQERRSTRRGATVLSAHGFAVTEKYLGVQTAFPASAESGPTRIGLCGEHEALPGLGHACGHNLIAAMSPEPRSPSRRRQTAATDRRGSRHASRGRRRPDRVARAWRQCRRRVHDRPAGDRPSTWQVSMSADCSGPLRIVQHTEPASEAGQLSSAGSRRTQPVRTPRDAQRSWSRTSKASLRASPTKLKATTVRTIAMPAG